MCAPCEQNAESPCAADCEAVDGGARVTCGEELCASGAICCMGCDGAFCTSDACSAAPCPPEGCRADADCSPEMYCVPPGVPPACGIGCAVERACESETDCEEGTVCVDYREACCQPSDPSSSRCQPPCTAGSCGEGLRCTPAGACEPVPCGDGFVCEAHTSCTGSGDEHGCQRRSCTSDGDCGSGYCVQGGCYGALGTCMLPSA